MYHTPSKDWDKKERKMDESDMGEEPEKEKVEVVTEEEEEQPVYSSPIFCVLCKDIAFQIYDGMSLCDECFTKEMAELIKNRKR